MEKKSAKCWFFVSFYSEATITTHTRFNVDTSNATSKFIKLKKCEKGNTNKQNRKINIYCHCVRIVSGTNLFFSMLILLWSSGHTIVVIILSSHWHTNTFSFADFIYVFIEWLFTSSKGNSLRYLFIYIFHISTENETMGERGTLEKWRHNIPFQLSFLSFC